jgi:RND family efflux transporter MFP subunit
MRIFLFGLCLGLAGCVRAPSGSSIEAPPRVAVSRPVERSVTDYADFTGRVAAVDSVELRARVWGYLEKVHFQEGALVQKGDVLFELDARPYQAALDLAQARVAQNEASLKLARQNSARGEALNAGKPAGISQAELDQLRAVQAQAVAALEQARANLVTARLNLDWTRVTAPVSGRVSRYVVTVGNLVQAGDQYGGTLLTTIVSVDPMYAYFDVDEYTALRVRQLAREGKSDSPRDGGFPVSLGMANEEGRPHQGTINFVDNQLNPKTGTIRLRGVFPNQDQVLLPGLFARVRAPVGRPHRALLVSERALDTDQGHKILYVVNDKNVVVSRAVRLGALHDGLREITAGLKPGERVIVNGLQQVRPGVVVEPRLEDMPAASGVGSPGPAVRAQPGIRGALSR